MVRLSTKGVEVKVDSSYLPSHSNPIQNNYFFVYEIVISNESHKTVQLLRRHWTIFDSLAPTRIVEGEGVVGETPILKPGEVFTYNSGCNLSSEIGSMQGYYLFQDLEQETFFEVDIPCFQLIVPSRLN